MPDQPTNAHEFFSNLLEKLERNGLIHKSGAKGCTMNDIHHIQKQFGIILPEYYKQFMLCLGQTSGSFLQGDDFHIDVVAEINLWVRQLLEESNEKYRLSSGDFVFLMHQGYEFVYFESGVGENPPVHQYVEGSGFHRNQWPSLSNFLTESAKNHCNFFTEAGTRTGY